MREVRVSVARIRVLIVRYPILRSKRFEVVCGFCGHNVYLGSFSAAIARARTMAEDHIPYSPDGSLSCADWDSDNETPRWSGDEMRWTP